MILQEQMEKIIISKKHLFLIVDGSIPDN